MKIEIRLMWPQDKECLQGQKLARHGMGSPSIERDCLELLLWLGTSGLQNWRRIRVRFCFCFCFFPTPCLHVQQASTPVYFLPDHLQESLTFTEWLSYCSPIIISTCSKVWDTATILGIHSVQGWLQLQISTSPPALSSKVGDWAGVRRVKRTGQIPSKF